VGKAWPIRLAAVLVVLRASCGAAPREHAAALARWGQTAPTHYLLRTDDQLNGGQCSQLVEVRDELIVRILSNTCRYPSLWTVSWLFRKAAGAPQEPCGRSIKGIGCVCRQQTVTSAEYDQRQGYPTRITITRTWRRSWSDAGLWRFLAQERSLPNCTLPQPGLDWTIVVREVRALP
jgi:hypothetical protein